MSPVGFSEVYPIGPSTILTFNLLMSAALNIPMITAISSDSTYGCSGLRWRTKTVQVSSPFRKPSENHGPFLLEALLNGGINLVLSDLGWLPQLLGADAGSARVTRFMSWSCCLVEACGKSLQATQAALMS